MGKSTKKAPKFRSTRINPFINVTPYFPVEEVAEGVFTFDLLHPVERNAIIEAVKLLPNDGAPNSMNKYGKVLSGRDLNGVVSSIVKNRVQPLVSHIWPMRKLSRRAYAMTVEYDVKKQSSLATHYDSSDVTLNVCLGGKFTGGDLLVYNAAGKLTARIKQRPGRAIVHLGKTLHRAAKLTHGTRTNLVLWCKQVKK